MIQTAELVRRLDDPNVLRLLDNTNNRSVPTRLYTNRAQVVFRKITALRTPFYPSLQLDYVSTEFLRKSLVGR